MVEIERRIAQETEIHDLLAEVETEIRSLDTQFARIRVEPVVFEQHKANEKLAAAVENTSHCLYCGKSVEEGGFCGYDCFISYSNTDMG